LHVRLPWKIGIAGINPVKMSHKLAKTELATNVEMVVKIEALPAICVLDWEEFLCDSIKYFKELLIDVPRSLVSFSSFVVEIIGCPSVFLEVLERFAFKQASAALDLCSAVVKGAKRIKSVNSIRQSHHISASPFSNINVFLDIFVDFLLALPSRYSNSWYMVSASDLEARLLLMNLIGGGSLAI
jgi:hypothetical protein